MVVNSSSGHSISDVQGDVQVVRRTNGIDGNAEICSRLMRDIFDKFDLVVVHLDDICIFSKHNGDHSLL